VALPAHQIEVLCRWPEFPEAAGIRQGRSGQGATRQAESGRRLYPEKVEVVLCDVRDFPKMQGDRSPWEVAEGHCSAPKISGKTKTGRKDTGLLPRDPDQGSFPQGQGARQHAEGQVALPEAG
jgi:hypothetical protein